MSQQGLLMGPAKGMPGARYSGSETGRSKCHGGVLGLREKRRNRTCWNCLLSLEIPGTAGSEGKLLMGGIP